MSHSMPQQMWKYLEPTYATVLITQCPYPYVSQWTSFPIKGPRYIFRPSFSLNLKIEDPEPLRAEQSEVPTRRELLQKRRRRRFHIIITYQ